MAGRPGVVLAFAPTGRGTGNAGPVVRPLHAGLTTVLNRWQSLTVTLSHIQRDIIGRLFELIEIKAIHMTYYKTCIPH